MSNSAFDPRAKRKTTIVKFLIALFILTPIAYLQTWVFGEFLIAVLEGDWGISSSSNIFYKIVETPIFALLFLFVLNIVADIIRYGRTSVKYIILGFILDITRLPIQIIADVLAFIAIFNRWRISLFEHPSDEDSRLESLRTYLFQITRSVYVEGKTTYRNTGRGSDDGTTDGKALRRAIQTSFLTAMPYIERNMYTYGEIDWKGGLTVSVDTAEKKVSVKGRLSYTVLPTYRGNSSYEINQALRYIVGQIEKEICSRVNLIISNKRSAGAIADNGAWTVTTDIHPAER